MWLLLVGFVGLVVGDGLFVYWLINDFHGIGAVLQDRLALSFMFDALLTLLILTVHFARRPPGPVRWPWFVVLALLGGLCFGLPVFWWLNTRRGSGTRGAVRGV
ncbi:MAG TPA: hypothetical protein VJ816_09450 [Gemmatimonadales bacterium]|nr:hypothetical protein [Gemmatimonadales bacterium]